MQFYQVKFTWIFATGLCADLICLQLLGRSSNFWPDEICYLKHFLLLANVRNEDFFGGNSKLNWILLFVPCLKDYDQKIVWDLYIPYGSSQFQLGKRVSNHRWQFFEQGFFMHVILALSKHCTKYFWKKFNS